MTRLTTPPQMAGLGAAAMEDAPVRIVVPAAAPTAGLGAAVMPSSGLDPSVDQAVSDWRDEAWRKRQGKAPPRGVVYAPSTPGAKQQEALNASIRAGNGQIGLGAAAMPPPSALQSAMGDTSGRIGEMQDFLAANPIGYRSRVNPERGLVEDAAHQFYGGGALQLEPFTPPPIEAGEDEFAYMQRVQALQAEDEQRQVNEAQTLGDVRDIGKSGHLGMAEAELQAAENVGSAELEQIERVAQVQGEAADKSRLAMEEAARARQEALDFADTQRAAMAALQETQKTASAKLQALPELDPNRAFKSMSGGAKFWAVLGGLAGGMIGSTDVVDRLAGIAQQDLEAQKANAAQAFDQSASADAAVSQQLNIYRELQAAVGEAADPTWLKMQYEDAEQMLQAELARTTLPVEQAKLQESLVGLRGKINDEQMRIDALLATTPHNIVTSYDPVGARNRRKIEKQIDKERDFERDLTKLGIAGEEAGLERKARLAEKKADAGKEKTTQAQGLVAQHAKETARLRGTTTGLKSFREKFRTGDIEGRGLGAYFATEEGRAVREDLKEYARRQIRGESGANTPENEIEDRADSLMAGWGDNELLQNVDRLVTANEREIVAAERGIGEEGRKLYYNDPDLAPLPPLRPLSEAGAIDDTTAASRGWQRIQ